MMKILYIADINYTGYGIATHNLLDNINANVNVSSNYEFYYFGINNINLNLPDELIKLNIKKFYHINYVKDDIKSLMGLNEIVNIVDKIEPNMIISLNDNGILFNQFNKIINESIYYKQFKPYLVAYMPVDCEYITPNFFYELENIVDYFITMNNFSCGILKQTGIVKPIYILEHIINVPSGSPSGLPSGLHNEDKMKCREYFWGNKYNDYFIVLNYNNIQKRKRIDITIDAFYKFYLNLKDMNPNSNNDPKILLILKSDKERIIKFPEDRNFMDHIIIMDKKLTINELYILYNSTNVGINTSVGEGWGLIPCEHCMFKIPQIIPDNTCSRELFENSQYIKTQSYPYGYAHLNFNNNYESPTCIFVAQLKLKEINEMNEMNELTYVTSIDIIESTCNVLIDKDNLSLNIYGVQMHYKLNKLSDIKRIIDECNAIQSIQSIQAIQVIQVFYMTGIWLRDLDLYDPSIFKKPEFKEYNIKCLKKFDLSQYLLKCNVPKSDHASELLYNFYSDETLSNNIGSYQCELMKNKYNKITIQKKFIDILNLIK